MKLHILSDLHLEFSARHPPLHFPPTDAEVVILAGDIDNGTRGIDWAEATFPRQTVLYVPGNHEFYDNEWSAALTALRERAAASPNVRVLDGDQVTVDGVRFLGATLWTDFELYGEANRAPALEQAQALVADFRAVRFGEQRLTPEQTIEFHQRAVDFLSHELQQPFDGQTVVVTHHAPHAGSIHPRWKDSLVNAAFVSDLSRLMGRAPLWIHGHTHDSFDYRHNGTRVLANPMGYRKSPRGLAVPGEVPAVQFENTRFDPGCVVDMKAA